MEQTYLYYPAKKVHRILLASELEKKGYKSVFSDPDELSMILRKDGFFAKKKFFEVKVSPTTEQDISCVCVSQIYTEKPKSDNERDLVHAILKIF